MILYHLLYPHLINLARIKGAIYRAWRVNLFREGGVGQPLPGHILRRMGAA